MFPSLGRVSVLQAVQFLHDNIWTKMKKHRKCRGDGMCFYINRFNRFDRHLDRLGGGGDPKLFHKITFADVMRFVKFDLEANDLFLLDPTLLHSCASSVVLPLVAPVLHPWHVLIAFSVKTCIINMLPPSPLTLSLPYTPSTSRPSLYDLEIIWKA